MADEEKPQLALTKKQLKALQFRGKIAKPTKEDKPATEPTDSTTSDHTVNKKKQKTKAKKAQREKEAKEAAKNKPKEKFKPQVSETGNQVRFIVFVGNLSFKTTKEEVEEFLEQANPVSVRLMTNKQTGESRGFAFVEFGSAADLKHALKFHHMQLGSRKVNIELTAGGGGNSSTRQDKLKRRREDLEKERQKETVKRKRASEEKVAAPEGNDAAAGGDDLDGDFAPNVNDNGNNDAEDDHGNDEYDGGDKKQKKTNRRKRGRGGRK
ncbi:hypothetical protein FBU59_001807 [Linderina macrospora]|uniref:Uncharacterized protein n=1 Tax=Linderina macrospora TaxID=4868 RepID=A0ACC1JCR8_9FUNG|nr:hypothetical protein FBU59_001807 [Linderina macrospora]